MSEQVVVTCVFCGLAYGPGTPTHGAEVLVEHIRVCKKHPMRHVESVARKLLDGAMTMMAAETIDDAREMRKGLAVLCVSGNRDAIEQALQTIPMVDAVIEALESGLVAGASR